MVSGCLNYNVYRIILHVCIIRVIVITLQSLVALHLPVSEIPNVISKVVYCCFTTTLLIMIIFGCSSKAYVYQVSS